MVWFRVAYGHEKWVLQGVFDIVSAAIFDVFEKHF